MCVCVCNKHYIFYYPGLGFLSLLLVWFRMGCWGWVSSSNTAMRISHNAFLPNGRGNYIDYNNDIWNVHTALQLRTARRVRLPALKSQLCHFPTLSRRFKLLWTSATSSVKWETLKVVIVKDSEYSEFKPAEGFHGWLEISAQMLASTV